MHVQTPARSLAAGAAAHGIGAVAEATGEALRELAQRPALLFAFTSRLDPDRTARELRDAHVPAVGVTGKGAFSAAGPVEEGCVALALGGDVRAGVGVGRAASRNLRHAGRTAAAAALAELEEAAPSLVVLLTDSGSGDCADAIAGAYESCGPAVPLAGGAAGGPRRAQFAQGAALADAVVAVALSLPAGVAVGTAHSCEVRGMPCVVTRSDGRAILEIDGRPAEDVYLEALGEPRPARDHDFEALAARHPLAQPELRGARRLRHVLGRGRGGSLLCATRIPVNAAVEFTRLDREGLARAGWESVNGAIEALDAPARAALVFDCAGRRGVLGDAQADEVAAITAGFGSAPPPFAGAYTNGEVARVRGARGDHNHAVVTAALA